MADAAFSRVDTATFFAFIDNAISEITNRDEDYLTFFPIVFPNLEEFIQNNSDVLARCEINKDEVEEIFSEGYNYISRKYNTVRRKVHSFFSDWTGSILMDAYVAARDEIDFGVFRDPGETIADVLGGRYERCSTRGGVAYYIRKKGAIPVILVNATGLPIEVWIELLGDDTHDYRLVVPVRPHGDLFTGGIQRDISLDREVEEIASIVGGEFLDGVHVLGWCNGARPSIELISSLGNTAASLTLVTPMLKGIGDIPASPTPYARDLQMILDLVHKTPKMAEVFTRKLAETANPIDWNRVAPDDIRKADEIFRLPNRRSIEGLLRPLLTADSLANVARRVASDETHLTMEKLSALTVPTMVILGSHDTIVSNRNTLDTLERARCTSVKFMLFGAGHDLHDLQYRYLRHALSHFIDRRQPPQPTVRFRTLN